MESFCGSQYWNLNKTWNTDEPDFTQCFQETALVWGPCALFWLLSIYDIREIVKSDKRPLPWTFINISKLILSLLLVILNSLELINSLLTITTLYPVSYYTPFIKLVTFILTTGLIYYQRLKGIHTSAALFILWFLLSLTSAVNYRTLLTVVFWNGEFDGMVNDVVFVTRMASSPIIFCQLLFSCFADVLVESKDEKKQCPKNSASFLSMLTFWWVNPLVNLGYKRPLTIEDMWEPLKSFLTEYNLKKFSKNYYKSSLKEETVPINGSNYNIIKTVEERGRSSGILLPLLKTYWAFALLLFVFKLATSLLTFIGPTVLDWLISFVSNPSEPQWRGFLYTSLLFFSSMIVSLVGSQSMYYGNLIRLKMRACMTNTIYKKSLMLSNDGRKNFTIGEIVNLMTMDTHRIVEFVPLVNSMWSAPLQIVIAVYLLWQQLGIATLAGVSVMLILMPINGFVATRLRLLQMSLMKLKDKRIKLMNEILSGIRVWKMYAWEQSFNEKVMQIRNNEISNLIKRAFYHGFIIFSFNSAQVLVSVVSFAVFVLIDRNNVLDANVAFVSLSLFGILGGPLTMVPNLITQFVMFTVSLRRVNKYLNSDEIDFDSIEHNENIEDPIVLEEASFSWSNESPIPALNDISLKIRKNKLVAIVGQVGSGKSSLLSALLGDMIKNGGKVNVNGSIAYVPQQAWILNSTLKENVLFMKPMNKNKFDKVIDCCALLPDLEILPGGEMTEIGEKGINLSGGQKQRVSMARACYADADIYFLDDPISALDANVGKHVFEKVIGPNGILKNRTRILVTHRISLLPKVDEIIVMKNGSVSEWGTYRELLERKGDFADFLIQYIENADEGLNEDEIEVLEEIVSKIKPELERTLSRSKSVNSEEGLRRRTLSILSKSSLTEGKTEKTKEVLDKGKKRGRGKLIDQEMAETGSVKWSVYMDYLKKVGIISLLAVFFSDVLLSGLNFGSSLWLSAWSDDSLDPNAKFDDSLRNLRLGVYGAFGGGQTIFTLIATISITLACLNGAKILHNEMLVHMMRAPISHFDTTPMGRILNRFSKDIDVADTVLGMSLRMVMMRLFSTIVSFAIIGYETPYVLLALIPLGILYYFIQRYYISTSRQLRRIQSNARSPVIGHFSETLSGSSSIRAYGMTKKFIDESNVRVDIHHNTTYESTVANRWLATRLEFLGYSIVLIDALFIVFTRDSVSPGVAGLTLSYAMKITGTLNQLVTASTTLETDIVSIERCVEYTQTPTEAEWFIDETKPDKSWPQKGAIKFDKYSTRYREGLDLVLKQITFKVESGQRVGVVGRTGAGKSSLTLALFRLLEPSDGTIFIDSIDISKLGLYELRSKLTIIPQDPVLFTGNLRVNLDPFEKYSDQQIWSALELAHLKNFVSSLSEGLNYSITEGGNNLSVGQKQLVCLARALLRRSRVLVLDEATAAVDVETDELIQETIRKEFNDCTIVTIAHRLNTILDYDMILVMDNGRISEYDSPKALLENSDSLFYGMAKDAGLI